MTLTIAVILEDEYNKIYNNPKIFYMEARSVNVVIVAN